MIYFENTLMFNVVSCYFLISYLQVILGYCQYLLYIIIYLYISSSFGKINNATMLYVCLYI